MFRKARSVLVAEFDEFRDHDQSVMVRFWGHAMVMDGSAGQNWRRRRARRHWRDACARWHHTALGLTSAVLAALLACGCAGNGSGVATATLPSLPELPKIELPKPPPPVVGTPTEVYERIGRGAMSCWFGKDGPLKGGYIYDAVAEPASKGGRAEITIRERETGAPSPRGVKAFSIAIEPSGEDETSVLAENLKLPEPVATSMKKSVAAWSIGGQGCDPDAFKGAWSSAPAAVAPPTGRPAAKSKTTQHNARVAKP